MATSSSNTTVLMSLGQYLTTYIILAVVAFLVALITYLLGHPTISQDVVVAAFMVGITAAIAQYASTGNIPGTPVSIHTVLIGLVTAGLWALEWFAGQTQLNETTIFTGTILFLESFAHEIQPAPQTGTTAPAGATR